MSSRLITINLVVYNGEKYIRQCLDSVLAQTYPHELIEINILDNASSDSTASIMESLIENLKLKIKNCSFLKIKMNLGMWPAQEELLKHSCGKYVVVLSVDVILDKDFVKNAVTAMERDSQIGALQAKIYKYEFPFIQNTKYDTIDTLGFKIFRSRRIVNIGHGEIDRGQYDKNVSCFAKTSQDTAQICLKQIWAVEGAVPVFRRQALDECQLESQGGKIVDPDFFWYGDDLDTAWRMRLFGWKQIYTPAVIAWHDRKTTKTLAGNWFDFIKIRKTVPMFKRQLDWRNTIFTLIKNDFSFNLLRDLPHIAWRQLRLWAYFLMLEPAMIIEIFRVAKMLPKMLKRRREIMRKAKILPQDLRKWII